LWLAGRKSLDAPWELPVNLGPGVNTGEAEGEPIFSPDGKSILFARGDDFLMTVPGAGGLSARILATPPGYGYTRSLSPDGRTMYFDVNRPGGQGGQDLWLSRLVPKATALAKPAAGVPAPQPTEGRWPFDPPDGREYVWGEPENLGPPINSDKGAGKPAISGDGLRLLFERYGTIFEASRAALDHPFGEPKSLSGLLTKAGLERPRGFYLTPDGFALYFSARAKADAAADLTQLYFVHRTGLDDPWGTPAPVAGISDKSYRITVSPDELTAYFASDRGKQFRLFTTARKSLDAPFGAATEIELDYKAFQAPVAPHLMPDGRTLVFRRGQSAETGERFAWARRDAAGYWTARLFERLESHPSDEHPSLTADGRTMFFASSRPGSLGASDIWVTRRVPKAGATTIPVEALTFAGHRYLLVERSGNWDEAKARAEAMGGHLAAINSQEERDWITENLWIKRANVTDKDSCFLGGALASDGKTWNWVTGEPIDLSLWSGRKGPDNPHPKDDILVWVAKGAWDDRGGGKATKATHFLVEWDRDNPIQAPKPAASGTK
jgi:hypothetical protein